MAIGVIRTKRDERDKRSKCNMRFQTGCYTAKKTKKQKERKKILGLLTKIAIK